MTFSYKNFKKIIHNKVNIHQKNKIKGIKIKKYQEFKNNLIKVNEKSKELYYNKILIKIK